MDTYRIGRQKAAEAAEAFRAALSEIGLPERVWGGVRPVVTHRGAPYVHLGMIRADAVEHMAEAMRGPAEAAE